MNPGTRSWPIGLKGAERLCWFYRPAAADKTVVAADVTQNQVKNGERVLFMAHRGELLTQAADKIRAFSGLESALEKAESTSLGSMFPVTIGSVQTLCRENRLNQFPADHFQTIIVDEAHHIMSDTYMNVLNHFPNAKVLGISATPDRADKKCLANYFDCLAYEYTLTQAIHDGYLCPIKAQMIPLKLDISNVKVSNGDYSAGEIGTALEPYLRMIAQEIAQNYFHRKIVVFLPLVHTSQTFCKILQEMGLAAAEVNGESPDRAQILQDFEDGKYTILCNSMLLTEGWDCPSVDCVVMLRPTKIRSLYQQCIGRGTRLFPGKEELLILDFLWLTDRHDLCRPSSLIAKNVEIAKRIDQQIMDSTDVVDIIDAEDMAEKSVIEEREQAIAEQIARMQQRSKKLVDPLQYAVSIAAEDLLNYEPTFRWETMKPTEKQLQFLEKRGISPEFVESKGKASILVDRLIRRQDEGLSTPKQIRCLEHYGFRHVGTWTFEQASNMITRLSQNNWRAPYGINISTYKP